MEESLINENIFKRSIFKKSSKDELEESLKYYTEKEEYEKCMIIKDFIDSKYYIDDPLHSDIMKLTKIILDNKDKIDDLGIDESIVKKIKSTNSEKDISKILIDDLDDDISDIIVSILSDDELRYIYFKILYDEIMNIDMPDVKREKTLKLVKEYRNETIEYVKKNI